MIGEVFKAVCRCRRCRDGVTAIEFSLLAVPFVTFVIGIIELSVMELGNAVLNGAVYDAARMIRTGQVQNSVDEDPETVFRNAMCDHASLMLDCQQIQYEVVTLDSFSDADDLPPIELNEDGQMEDPPFDPGEDKSVVMIRVVYLYPLMTPMIGTFFSDWPGNKRVMETNVVIETEPYNFEDDDEA